MEEGKRMGQDEFATIQFVKEEEEDNGDLRKLLGKEC